MPPKYGYVDRDGPRDSNGVDMSVRCSHCNNKHRFKVSISDYNKWAEGHDDIKSLGHYMNDNAKEIASDGMCKDCKSKNMEKSVEELIKSCPRCGKSSANKSNPSGRCRTCLNKLAANKKKPGHWQRAQTKADDALRRQKGDNGTAHKKSTGLGNRASIVKQVKRAERKTGQKLSPDRKNNGKGYAASNTRMVPEHLNRGRHKVDNKKLKAWRKRLKKSNIDLEEFYKLVLAKAKKTISGLRKEDIINFMKGAAEQLEEVPSIHGEIGKVHTVEIHPDLDHLYNIKNLINQDPRKKIKVIDVKNNKVLNHMASKVPRDSNGWITSDIIDKHIDKLPKQKVNVRVLPYTWGAQNHRNIHKYGANQYVLSAELHPDSYVKMDEDTKKLWDNISGWQHKFEGGTKNQFGWSRIDPYKVDFNNKLLPNNNWHVDEIQSDFQNKDKISEKVPHETENAKQSLLNILSHGHEDPQHAIHSIANALARKMNVNSISMDTPEDQARQSKLNETYEYDRQQYEQDRQEDEALIQHTQRVHPARWEAQLKQLKDKTHPHYRNPNFASAVEKIGLDGLTNAANGTVGISSSVDLPDNIYGIEENPELKNKINALSVPESDALHDMLFDYRRDVEEDFDPADYGVIRATPEREEQAKRSDVPVHQLNTYNKRPKKLGMIRLPKKDVLGDDPSDEQKEVQYMRLHKNWHKKLKKHNVSSDEMYTCALAKAEELNDQKLVTLLRSITADDLFNFIKKQNV